MCDANASDEDALEEAEFRAYAENARQFRGALRQAVFDLGRQPLRYANEPRPDTITLPEGVWKPCSCATREYKIARKGAWVRCTSCGNEASYASQRGDRPPVPPQEAVAS